MSFDMAGPFLATLLVCTFCWSKFNSSLWGLSGSFPVIFLYFPSSCTLSFHFSWCYLSLGNIWALLPPPFFAFVIFVSPLLHSPIFFLSFEFSCILVIMCKITHLNHTSLFWFNTIFLRGSTSCYNCEGSSPSLWKIRTLLTAESICPPDYVPFLFPLFFNYFLHLNSGQCLELCNPQKQRTCIGSEVQKIPSASPLVRQTRKSGSWLTTMLHNLWFLPNFHHCYGDLMAWNTLIKL